MKRRCALIFVTTALAVSLVACGGAEIESENDVVSEETITDVDHSESEEFEIDSEIDNSDSVTADSSDSDSFDIDIDKCIEDLKANLPLEPDYSFVRDYAILSDGKNITISIIVDDSTDPDKALDFADTVVRLLNLYANIQDSNVELASKDFYGGLYTEYTALVGVAQNSKINSQDEWLVFDAIVGGKTMLKLK